MLNILRKRASSWMIKIIFGVIIAVFVLWGVGNLRERERTVVGTVGKQDVSYAEYREILNNLQETYKRLFGDKFDYKIVEERVKQEAWDVSVERKILIKKAADMKVTVSEAEIIDELQKQEAFKENGQFSRDKYLDIMRQMNMAPASYENQLERALLLRKMRDIIMSAVTISDTETESLYRAKNKSMKVGYVTFKYKDYLGQTRVNEEEEKIFYEQNKDLFKKPETSEILYVYIPFDQAMNSVKVDDNDIKEHYDEHKSEYSIPKTYNYRHIFVKFDKNNKEASRKKIVEAKQLLAKESMAKVAAKYNTDGTRAKGGLVGDVTLQNVTPAIGAKISVMSKGDVSDIVESEYGFHIIKIEDVKEERAREISEVKDKIIIKIKEHKAKNMTIRKASEIKSALETAREKDLTGVYQPKKTVVVKGKANIGDMGELPEVAKTIALSGEGKTFGPTPITRGVIVGKVVKIDRGSYTFAEVRTKVKEGALKKKATEKAIAKAEEATKSKTPLKGTVTDWFTPMTGMPKPLNILQELDKDVFGLSKKTPVLNKAYTGIDVYYVVYFVDEKITKWDPNAEDAKKFKEDFLSTKRKIYYDEWLKSEKAAVKIKRNEELFKSI